MEKQAGRQRIINFVLGLKFNDVRAASVCFSELVG